MKTDTIKKVTFTKPKMLVFSSLKVSCGMGSLMLAWVTYFATEYLGLAATTVGLLFMVSKIFDGFTDIVAGYIIDKTHSKLGKGRPFDLAQIGYWICVILLFVVPMMSVNMTYAWVFVMYTLAESVFMTLIFCSDPVYMANVIDEPKQSITANAVIGMVSMVVSTVGGIIIPQLVANVGTSRVGWGIIAIAIGVPSLAIGLLRFFIVKEKEGKRQSVEAFSVRDMIRVITHNKYIVIVALINFVSSIGYKLSYGVTNYYCDYILGDVGLASWMSLTALSSVATIILTPIVTKKMGFTKFMRLLTIISIATSLLRLVNPYHFLLIFLTGFFCNIGTLTVWLYLNTFIIDCMDYGEWNTGVRGEGSTACVQSVLGKVGTAFGVGLVGILMGMSGYSGSLETQPDSAITMLIVLFSVAPAVFLLIQYILLRMYDLEEKLPKIRKELAERKEKA